MNRRAHWQPKPDKWAIIEDINAHLRKALLDENASLKNPDRITLHDLQKIECALDALSDQAKRNTL